METIRAQQQVDGWVLGLGPEDLPVAVHPDTGGVYGLVYNDDWREAEPRLDDDLSHYSRDWSSSPLDQYWGDAPSLMAALIDLAERGLLRVEGAIYGVPGTSRMGAILV